MKANERKTQLLGESLGKATNQLRKGLLFELAKRLELLTCHQCGTPITSVAEFSIEHKLPWMSAENPRGAFFDIENIAFSHLRCNSGAHNRNAEFCERGHRLESRPGTDRRYCPICRREWMTQYMRDYRSK